MMPGSFVGFSPSVTVICCSVGVKPQPCVTVADVAPLAMLPVPLKSSVPPAPVPRWVWVRMTPSGAFASWRSRPSPVRMAPSRAFSFSNSRSSLVMRPGRGRRWLMSAGSCRDHREIVVDRCAVRVVQRQVDPGSAGGTDRRQLVDLVLRCDRQIESICYKGEGERCRDRAISDEAFQLNVEGSVHEGLAGVHGEVEIVGVWRWRRIFEDVGDHTALRVDAEHTVQRCLM